MNIIAFAKKWSLPCSLIVGTVVYLLFANISVLEPFGEIAGPFVTGLMPYVLFTLLYVTFCKIEIREMKPRLWHFILQPRKAHSIFWLNQSERQHAYPS